MSNLPAIGTLSMATLEQPNDLIVAIDEAKAYIFQRAIYWPKRWQEFSTPKSITWKWQSVPFHKSSYKCIPDNKHGLYSFVLCPNVAQHPKNHFILYIGKADKMTLRQRFKSYLQEMQRIKRPAIFYTLNRYSGYLEFCFTPAKDPKDIATAERSLLSALIPPLNTDFPASVSKIIRGLR
jgi:hypothetical protein